MESCAALRKVTTVVERFRWCIISFWAVALIVGGAGAAFFIPACVLSFDPEKGMDSYDAEHRFKSKFPNEAASTQWIGLLEVPSPGHVMDQGNFANFSSDLLASLNDTGFLLSFSSASTLGALDPQLSKSLISSSGNATMVQWVTRHPFAQKSNLDFSKHVQHKLEAARDKHLPTVPFADVISLSSFATGAVADSEKSLGEMDAISLPLAFLIFWCIVKSGRLLILPACGMACCLAVSFGIMYLVAQVEEVQQTTPSLMMSILIAMSIDYSLFIMTRFRDELGRLAPGSSAPEDAVREALMNTMETAGFTVLLSCLTLMVSFVALIFAPIVIIASLGQGCVIALLISLSVHLTLLPAVVLCFPRFFSQAVSPDRKGIRVMLRCCPRFVKRCCLQDKAANVNPAAVDPEALNDAAPSSPDERNKASQHPACFVWLARVTTTFPNNVIIVVVVVAATLAIGYPILGLKTTASFVLTVPRGTEASRGVVRLADAFGIGTMTPFQLMLENPAGDVFQEPFWTDAQNILKELSQSLPRTTEQDFTFVNFLAGTELPLDVVKPCWHSTSTAKPCPEVNYLLNQFVNEDASAMYGLITLKWDPLDPAGNTWLKDARAFVKAQDKENASVKLTLSGEAADTWDIVNAVYDFFPWVITITLSVALLMLGLAFKSIVIPLRSVASIGLTLLWVYGFATLVYQHGILDWVGLPGLTGKYKAHQWFVPAISFSVVCGICLDYDIFLLSKTTELREMGWGPVEATREALCSTGGIITAAGVIMAIAFLGLMFASMLVINELSVFLVFAVLYDTFVVRSLLSPALMSLIGRHAWYPSKLSKMS